MRLALEFLPIALMGFCMASIVAVVVSASRLGDHVATLELVPLAVLMPRVLKSNACNVRMFFAVTIHRIYVIILDRGDIKWCGLL